MRRKSICVALVALAIGCSTGESREQSSSRNSAPPLEGRKSINVSPPTELAQPGIATQPITRGAGAGPSLPEPALWLQPADLLTSTGITPIRAYIENGGQPLQQELLDAVASQLELRDYPALRLIPNSVVRHNPTTLLANNDTEKGGVPTPEPEGERRSFIELKPDRPLDDTWYVVGLKSVPKGLGMAPWSAPTPPFGAYASRFHPGSRPTVTRIVLCKKNSDSTRAVVEFSENVTTGELTQPPMTFEQFGEVKKCSTAQSGPTPSSSVKWIHEDCSGLSPSDPFHLKIDLATLAQGKAPLRTFDGSSQVDQAIDPKQLATGADGCAAWRP